MHQIHNSENVYCWQFKGRKGTKKIPSNTGRRRINIIGGISTITFESTTIITEKNCNKDIIVEFIVKLRKQYPNAKRIYMILDNAKYNRAKTVTKQAKESGVILIYLPPYCPNLNLIERLWKFLRKRLHIINTMNILMTLKMSSIYSLILYQIEK